MIVWISLAFAVDSAQLVAELPAARAQLESCAQERCADEVGARAAFVAAVGTYVEQGRADGALAGASADLPRAGSGGRLPHAVCPGP